MAKLTTKGTTILARWRKDEQTPDDELVSERTRAYAVRSNGVILRRDAVRFRSDTGYHDYGWKVSGKAKIDGKLVTGGANLDECIGLMSASLVAKGFTRVE